MSRPSPSFRDPAGSCCCLDGRIIRLLSHSAAADCDRFLQTPTARTFAGRKQLVNTRRLTSAESSDVLQRFKLQYSVADADVAAVFEHERLAFANYPYEWSPEMLWDAGRLTLDLAQTCLSDGFCLKDATPFNVLFSATEPVFIDLGSFEPRDPGDTLWRPYGQFVRTFLLPLLANRYWRVPLANIFTTCRDGLEPATVYEHCTRWQRLVPPILWWVSLPMWLNGKARVQGAELYAPRRSSNPERARFVLDSIFKQLRRGLDSLRPHQDQKSVWTVYSQDNSYSVESFEAKELFVDSVLQQFKPNRLLDVGANTGHFSLRAARTGANVIAVDADPVCMGALYQQARIEKLNILPLVVDICRPSPALGWRNSEAPSFLERAGAGFDCVLMLGLVHHLLVTERIPLEEVFRLAADLTTSLLIIEFIGPDDPMFRLITRGRDHLHKDLTPAVFEQSAAREFETIRTLTLSGTQRRLYALERKGRPA